MTERCEVLDESGQKLALDLVVTKRLTLCVDCRCYSHKRPGERFTLLVTHGGAYVRAEGNDGFFRSLDAIGPLSLAIERVTQE